MANYSGAFPESLFEEESLPPEDIIFDAPETIALTIDASATGTETLPSPTITLINSVQADGNSFMITFTRITGATGYTVEKSEDAGATWTTQTTTDLGFPTGPVRYVVDGTNTPGEEYLYRVTAFNNDLTSAPSDSFAWTAFREPDAPTNLVGVPGDASVELTWEAPAFDGGSPITGYRVVVMDENQIFISSVQLAVVFTYTVTGLANDTAYTFKVQAENAAQNETNFSNVVSITPFDPVILFDTLDTVSITVDAAATGEEWVVAEPADETPIPITFGGYGYGYYDVPVAMPPAGIINPITDTYLVQPDPLVIEQLYTDFPAATTPQPIYALTKTQPLMPSPSSVMGKLGRPKSNDFVPSSITREALGWLRVVVEGRDVTFLRGAPVQVSSLTENEPFGWGTAVLEFPQLSPFEDENTAERAWLKDGFDVEISLVGLDGSLIATLFEGFIVERDMSVEAKGGVGITVSCLGALYQADFTLAMQRLVVNNMDIGYRILNRLRIVPGRRYQEVDPWSVVTGITNHDGGSWEPLLTGFIQDMLAESTTDDGQNQWTLSCDPNRKPVLKLKDRDTVHHTITLGTPGVSVRLHRDITQTTTTVYGQGVDEDRRGFANLKLPFRDEQDNNLPYPFEDPNRILKRGDTDAMTVTGTGVSAVQKRLRRSGNKVKVTGVFDERLENAVKNYQRNNGLDVTGEVGGQTWTAMFASGNIIKKAFYAPFATLSAVEPFLYNSDGQQIGTNPNFDPNKLRIEKWRTFTDGLSKSDAFRVARAEVLRDYDPGWTGSITLTVDPETTHRWQIRAGHNIQIKGWQGSNLLVHIASVSRKANGETELTVDSRARDLLTLDAIEKRDRENTGPARRKQLGPVKESSLQRTTPIIDSELQGWIDDVPLEEKKWVVMRVPLGTVGSIVGVELETSPPTRFAVAMFEGKVTPNDLNELMTSDGSDNPSPLQFRLDGKSPFPGDEATAAELENYGWLDTLGGPGQAAGYWTGKESNGDPLTGKHFDNQLNLNFEAVDELWVWVAFWAEDASFINGRLLVAPQK